MELTVLEYYFAYKGKFALPETGMTNLSTMVIIA